MEWLNSLSKAIEYIENHLEQEISFDEAARIASCSTYYFQRIFSYVAGISLAEYIRRRRMTQAAFELQRTDKKCFGDCLKNMGMPPRLLLTERFSPYMGFPLLQPNKKGLF